MSKYTIEVRYICESASGLKESKGQSSVNEILSKSVDKVFDFDFPIFDENYRFNLEKKILKHYYTREIGEETVGLWKLRLDTKLNEIMPYYNQLYKSELLEFNPLYTSNLTRSGNKKGNVNSTDNGNSSFSEGSNENNKMNSTNNETTGQTRAYSDTPQGSIVNVDNNSYLTNYTKDSGNSSGSNFVSGESSRTANGQSTNFLSKDVGSTEEYLESVVGYQGANASELLQKYRETFLNIDMLVIKDLESLFMQLW